VLGANGPAIAEVLSQIVRGDRQTHVSHQGHLVHIRSGPLSEPTLGPVPIRAYSVPNFTDAIWRDGAIGRISRNSWSFFSGIGAVVRDHGAHRYAEQLSNPAVVAHFPAIPYLEPEAAGTREPGHGEPGTWWKWWLWMGAGVVHLGKKLHRIWALFAQGELPD
jgi:hypothetical protein